MVGLGAFPNPLGLTLHDRTGFDLYEKHTGEPLDVRSGGNFYHEGTAARYREIVRSEYLRAAGEMPLIVVRNAVLNLLASYSIGYVTRSLSLTYLSAASGAVFLGILLWRRRFVSVIAIGACSATFVPYYVPVPVYMFAAYALIVAALIDVLDDVPSWRTVGASA